MLVLFLIVACTTPNETTNAAQTTTTITAVINTYYADADADGYGDGSRPVEAAYIGSYGIPALNDLSLHPTCP